jgi:transmembrane sensor
MNEDTPSQAPISEQAAEWLVELTEPGAGGLEEERRRRFMAWLKRSPQHIEEFLALAMLQQDLAGQPVPLAKIVADLKAAGPAPPEPLFGNVAAGSATTAPAAAASLRPGRELAGERAARRGRARRWLAFAAAAGVAAIAVALVQFTLVDAPAVRHATVLGEQRSVALDDGSVVMLNTLSEVDVDVSRSERRVALVAGEAMFDVAPDATRPFVVDAGNVSLTVLGTKFSVYRKDNVTRLAVVEGSVRVVPNGGLAELAEPLVVAAGEGLVAGREGITPLAAGTGIDMAIAWTERRLIFNAAPLADVVEQFNRYNATPIVVEDSALARREVTTVFNANDVDALVGFLELEPDVDVRHDGNAIRIRHKSADPEGQLPPTE